MLERIWIGGRRAEQLVLIVGESFPALALWPAASPPREPHVAISLDAAGRVASEPDEFDGEVLARTEAGVRDLYIEPGRAPASAPLALLTHYQRLFEMTPALESDEPALASVLRVHRQLFDVALPQSRAEYDHALDTRAWTLRLQPQATAAAQIAALFHDAARLPAAASHSHEDEEPASRDARAHEAARVTDGALADTGLKAETRARIRSLIERQEQSSDDAELKLLIDADILSFFSLRSAGFYNAHGLEPTRKRIVDVLGRLSAPLRPHLGEVRYSAAVAAIVGEELASLGVSVPA